MKKPNRPEPMASAIDLATHRRATTISAQLTAEMNLLNDPTPENKVALTRAAREAWDADAELSRLQDNKWRVRAGLPLWPVRDTPEWTTMLLGYCKAYSVDTYPGYREAVEAAQMRKK